MPENMQAMTGMAARPGTTRWFVAPFAAREREVRDILWLLLTASWIVMPHFTVLPV